MTLDLKSDSYSYCYFSLSILVILNLRHPTDFQSLLEVKEN